VAWQALICQRAAKLIWTLGPWSFAIHPNELANVLSQHAVNAAHPPRMVDPRFINLVMTTFAAIMFMAIFTSPVWAQEQDGKKTLGQRLVDDVAAKHRPQLI